MFCCRFADTITKMLHFYNTVGVFRNDETWYPCYYTLNLLWNYSDASRELCKVWFPWGQQLSEGTDSGYETKHKLRVNICLAKTEIC